MLRRASLSLLLLAACSKGAQAPETTREAVPIRATDELWRLAPAGLVGGLVAADGSLPLIQDGARALVAALDAAPAGGAAAERVRAAFDYHGIDLLDPQALAERGLDLARGAAAFGVPDGDEVDQVFVLPVSDRERFVVSMGGTVGAGDDVLGGGALTCRPIGDRYACARRAAALGRIGQGNAATVVSTWPAAQRGHLEVFAAPDRIGAGVGTFLTGTTELRIGIQLERGGATVRAHLTGTPTGLAAAAASAPRSPLVAELVRGAPAGVLVLDGSAMQAQIAATAAAVPKDVQLAGGVALREALAALRGDLIGWSEPGAPLRGQVAIGLTDEAPARALVAACALPFEAPGVALARDGDRCRATFSSIAPSPFAADVWVDRGALRLGFGDYRTVKVGRATPPFGKSLAGEHQLAFWGSGASLEGETFAGIASIPGTGPLMAWSVAHLSELGVGVRLASDGVHGVLRVRTTWSNPPDIVAELEPKLVALARGEEGAGDAIRALAKAHPDAPLAADVEVGAGGLVPLVGGVGVLAAVAIPAFMKYVRKSKTVEAVMFVKRLEQGARAAAAETAGRPRFPGPSAGPTPPLGTCCAQGERCIPNASQWDAEPWIALRFSLDDPHRYSYRYDVAKDGRSFTASAFGDLDCDGVYSTFTMRGSLGSGDAPIERVEELE